MVETVIPIISVLLSGGLVLGLLKLTPERQGLYAQAGERAVSSLIATMDELEERLESAQKREAKLLHEMAELRAEIIQLRRDLRAHKEGLVSLTVERDAWKQRAYDLGWKEQS